MTQILARFHRHQQRIADEQKIARILLETGDPPDTDQPKTYPRATLPGDTRRLRGLPVVGILITGASPGTIPHIDGVRNADRSSLGSRPL